MGKIRELYNQVIQTTLDITNFEPVIIQSNSLTYQKNKVTYNFLWDYSLGAIQTIALNNIPQEFIYNLRVILVITASEGIRTTTNYKNTVPQFKYILEDKGNNNYNLIIHYSNYPTSVDSTFKIILINPREQYELRTRKS
jgi:hypothetical protein